MVTWPANYIEYYTAQNFGGFGRQLAIQRPNAVSSCELK